MSDTLERIKIALADRYTIESELGRGGMATVYLAEDLKHHRKVAIKVLRPELAASIGVDRFLREIEIAARLTHPHILALYDSGESNGYLFYVMPYIDGESLRDRLGNERQLPLEESLQIAREVADALDYAHSEGVIHRDIKPENIMLSRGHAVVADFGIARAVSVAGGERLTETGMTLGTPDYMSPEQATAEEVDGRSDIYSLGCVLYEMLGGDPPYVGSTPRSVLARKLADPVPSLKALRTAVSDELQAVVKKALVREKVDRFKTAAEFAKALADPSSIVAPIATKPVEHAADRRGARMVGFAVLAAIVVMLAVGVLWLGFGGAGPTLDPELVAVLPLANHTGDESLDDVGQAVAYSITQGLGQIGFIQVIPTVAVLGSRAAASASQAESDPRAHSLAWARETGAGTFVHGSYSQRADSLAFQVQVLDSEDGAVLYSLDPVMTSADDPTLGIEILTQLVTGAFGAIFDPQFILASPGLPSETRLPAWDALRAYTTGQQLFSQNQWDAALEYFSAAVGADSSFVQAILLGALAHSNSGRYAAADSLAQIAAMARDRLGTLDRLSLDWLQGFLDGDYSRSMRAVREIPPLAPNTGWHFLAGLEATVSNRPREALEIYQTLDPYRGIFKVWTGYWFTSANAYHLLGDYRQELRTARAAREQFPEDQGIRFLEIRSLAALGRADDAISRLNDALTLPPVIGYGGDATTEVLRAGLELRAHGHREEAMTVMHRALSMLADRPSEVKQSWNHRLATASVTYLAERWDEATRQFRALAEESPFDRDVQGYLGVLAARSGNTSEVERVSNWLRDLDEPYLFGENTYWRARIASLSGEPEDAIRLLQTALAEGLRFGSAYDMFVNQPYLAIHTEMDFEPLHDYEPFLELMRPKG